VADYGNVGKAPAAARFWVRRLATECFWDAEIARWDTYVRVEDGFRGARGSDD
jgi:hypothetical protein